MGHDRIEGQHIADDLIAKDDVGSLAVSRDDKRVAGDQLVAAAVVDHLVTLVPAKASARKEEHRALDRLGALTRIGAARQSVLLDPHANEVFGYELTDTGLVECLDDLRTRVLHLPGS
jgi:hypothetical protein